MRRDMDLVRSVLIRTEAADVPLDLDAFYEDGRPPAETVYNLMLMEARGLIEADFERDMNGTVYRGRVIALTWDGQDYLDAMRDERVWAKAKRAIASSVGQTTFDVIKRVCVEVSTRMAISAISC